jgi:hypothetical protein
VTYALLLASDTLTPPEGAAAFSVTVQEAEPAVVNEEGEQLSALTRTCAWTVRVAVRLTPFAVAVMVALCCVDGVPAVAVNVAVVALAATVTDEGLER